MIPLECGDTGWRRHSDQASQVKYKDDLYRGDFEKRLSIYTHSILRTYVHYIIPYCQVSTFEQERNMMDVTYPQVRES